MNSFKVMTFNLRGSLFGMDEENIWENRALLNIITLKKAQADIIGFQEYQSGNQEAYDEHLYDYAYELGYKTIHDSEYYQHTPIYWKNDRFEKTSTGAFYLSKTPEVWSKDWDSSLVRGAMWVILKEKETDAELLVVNTHLDHIGEEARVEGAKLIVEKVKEIRKEKKLPTIIMGDFNSRAWGPAKEELPALPEEYQYEGLHPSGTVLKIFTEAGFKDTYSEAGKTDDLSVNTYHNFKGDDYPKIGMRIDWVLTLDGNSPFKTHDCEIITKAEPPIYPSDHYPVMATLSLENPDTTTASPSTP